MQQIELSFAREAQRLEYKVLIQNEEEHLSGYEISFEDTYVHRSSTKKKEHIPDYKIEFKLQMLAYEKELVLKQQATIRKLLQLHHERQARLLLSQQNLDTLDLSFLFASAQLNLEEKFSLDMNLITEGGSPADGESPSSTPSSTPSSAPSQSPTHTTSSAPEPHKNRFSLRLRRLSLDGGENERQEETRSPLKISPRYRSSKDSTPRSSPRRLSNTTKESSPSPHVIRDTSRASSPRYGTPTRTMTASPRTPEQRSETPRRASVGGDATKDSSPRSFHSRCDSSESHEMPQVTLCDSTSSSSSSSNGSSDSSESVGAPPTREGIEIGDQAFQGSTSSVTNSLDSKVFTDINDLRKAYYVEQEKIHQQAADYTNRTKQEESKHQQELAVPIVSLILLKHMQK